MSESTQTQSVKKQELAKKEEPTLDLQRLIRKAGDIGLAECPQSGSEIEQAVVAIFKANSPQIFTAKLIHGVIKQKSVKFYSDMLWNLAIKRKILEKLPQRGYYRFNQKA